MKNNQPGAIPLELKCILLFTWLFTACQVVDAQRGLVSFEPQVLDAEVAGGSGVKLADIDGDGLTDIIAMTSNPALLSWYRNPDWQAFTISGATSANIDSAPQDIDGDGDMDIVLISEFNLAESSSGGVLQWFENPGDPSVVQNWPRHFIDQVPASHRLSWGDINGDGDAELLNLPIVGIGAQAPLYDVGLQLKAYPVPPDPRMSGWPGVVLDRSLELSHGMTIEDWDSDGREDIVTASFGGVHVFQLASKAVTVAKTQVGAGKQDADRPEIGASEIAIGEDETGERFLATVEPWHGNEVVVYFQGLGQLWNRRVIDDGLVSGHALKVGDLNNDGRDEIIAGGRSEPYQLNIYSSSDSGWRRDRIDQEIAVSGLALGDLNSDGLLDIVAIGSATGNLVYFRNTGS